MRCCPPTQVVRFVPEEPVARAAAPGNAGSDTAADHVEVFDAARLCW